MGLFRTDETPPEAEEYDRPMVPAWKLGAIMRVQKRHRDERDEAERKLGALHQEVATHYAETAVDHGHPEGGVCEECSEADQRLWELHGGLPL